MTLGWELMSVFLGHVSTSLAVDSYGAWGREASNFLTQVTARLAIHAPITAKDIGIF